jgi:hypothetical protein
MEVPVFLSFEVSSCGQLFLIAKEGQFMKSTLSTMPEA